MGRLTRGPRGWSNGLASVTDQPLRRSRPELQDGPFTGVFSTAGGALATKTGGNIWSSGRGKDHRHWRRLSLSAAKMVATAPRSREKGDMFEDPRLLAFAPLANLASVFLVFSGRPPRFLSFSLTSCAPAAIVTSESFVPSV